MSDITYVPGEHQEIAFNFGMQLPYSALFLDMGLGKTVITLSILKYKLYNFDINKPLIVAPKDVAQHTWPEELNKWSHLSGLTYSVIAGNPVQRLRALRTPADIYIISWDNIVWLEGLKRFRTRWPFDMMVLDESHNIKSRDSKRYKSIKRVKPKVKSVVLLSGTPVPNSLMDIWAQIQMLDTKILYEYIVTFRMQYFHPGKPLPHGGSTYVINMGAEDMIFEKIKPLCLSMKAVDWIKLPPRQDIVREIELDDYTQFKQFKKEKILELEEQEILASNASALYNKLLQYANGAVYDNELHKAWHLVHDKKLDVLEEMIEALQGKPVLVFYQFKSDVERIKARIKTAKHYTHKGQIDPFNRGEIPVLLMHGASAIGINLQYGCHYCIWFGVGDNMGWYWQAVKRIDRQGQKFTVFNYHILIKGTPEQKVYRGLMDKTYTQDRLMEALK